MLSLNYRRAASFAFVAVLLIAASCGGNDDTAPGDSGAGLGGFGQGGATTAQTGASTGAGGECVHEGCPCVRDRVVVCYSGPPATRDVGLCKSATTICTRDYTIPAWCNGEVLPATERCLNEDDEDCDGHPCAAHLWSHTYGAAEDQYLFDAAVSQTSGNIVAVGAFLTTIDFGSGPLADPTTGYYSGFLAELDESGQPLFALRATSSSGVEFLSVALGPNDEPIVVGRFSKDVDLAADAALANDTLTNADGIARNFLVQYAAGGGAIAFSTVLGGATSDSAYVAANAQGEIAIATSAELRIYTSGGTVARSLALTATPATVAEPVFGGAGTIFVRGTNQVATSLPTTPAVPLPPPVNVAKLAHWVAKLSADLKTAQWSKPFGTACQITGMGADDTGEVVLIGQGDPGCDLGAGPFQEAAAYVARYTTTGAVRFVKRLRANTLPYMNSTAVDAQGNVLVAGTLRSIVTGDWGNVSGGPSDEAFVIKFDPDGAHLWSGALGAFEQPDGGNAVAAWKTGEVLLGGFVSGYVSFGGPTFESKGKIDAFLAKYAAY